MAEGADTVAVRICRLRQSAEMFAACGSRFEAARSLLALAALAEHAADSSVDLGRCRARAAKLLREIGMTSAGAGDYSSMSSANSVTMASANSGSLI
jgi:hypothetical protein